MVNKPTKIASKHFDMFGTHKQNLHTKNADKNDEDDDNDEKKMRAIERAKK